MAFSVKHQTLKYLQWLLPSAQGTCQNLHFNKTRNGVGKQEEGQRGYFHPETYNGHSNLFPSPLIASIPLLSQPSMYPLPFFSLEDDLVRLIGTAQPLNQSIWAFTSLLGIWLSITVNCCGLLVLSFFFFLKICFPLTTYSFIPTNSWVHSYFNLFSTVCMCMC